MHLSPLAGMSLPVVWPGSNVPNVRWHTTLFSILLLAPKGVYTLRLSDFQLSRMLAAAPLAGENVMWQNALRAFCHITFSPRRGAAARPVLASGDQKRGEVHYSEPLLIL